MIKNNNNLKKWLEEKLPDEEYNERNHIKMILHVKCEKSKGSKD